MKHKTKGEEVHRTSTGPKFSSSFVLSFIPCLGTITCFYMARWRELELNYDTVRLRCLCWERGDIDSTCKDKGKGCRIGLA